MINPERKDSLLLSLNKKVEILDRKLKEADSEHTRKLALGIISHDSDALCVQMFVCLFVCLSAFYFFDFFYSSGSAKEELGGVDRG